MGENALIPKICAGSYRQRRFFDDTEKSCYNRLNCMQFFSKIETDLLFAVWQIGLILHIPSSR